jgi:hypothetical protein
MVMSGQYQHVLYLNLAGIHACIDIYKMSYRFIVMGLNLCQAKNDLFSDALEFYHNGICLNDIIT